MNYQGIVSNISSFDYNGSKLWSFQLGGDKSIYYRTGDKAPKFERGDFVNFVGKPGKGNSVNVDFKSILAKKADAETVQQGIAPSSLSNKSAGVSKDDYWAAREARDVSVQKRIEIQSCRNSALEMVKILLSQEAIKLPAKQADKVETLEQLVAHYQQQFISENSGETDTSATAPDEVPEAVSNEDTY